MKALGDWWRERVSRFLAFMVATIGKGLMRLFLMTCRFEVAGLERFCEYASNEKCILMLWHNRLAITSFLLYRYAKQFSYAAFISSSRDGKLISALVDSYKQGKTIRVPHDARNEALRMLIRQIKETQDIVIITPDGPRGPRYEVKPGIAMAALSTGAYVIPFTWEADRCWKLNSWDQLWIPRPFSTIKAVFEKPLHFDRKAGVTLEEVQKALEASLPKDWLLKHELRP